MNEVGKSTRHGINPGVYSSNLILLKVDVSMVNDWGEQSEQKAPSGKKFARFVPKNLRSVTFFCN